MISGLILAAGESSRMGRDKALLHYHGRTFLETAIAVLREAEIHPIVVVLGHHADEIRGAVNLETTQVFINKDYRLGQTSSLQAGLRALTDPQIEAAVLWLVDHPAVSTQTVRELINKFLETRAPLAMPTYHGERGHPVLIARALFDELLRLAPGEGANAVMRRHRDETAWIEVNDPGVLEDIDDPDSYRHLQK